MRRDLWAGTLKWCVNDEGLLRRDLWAGTLKWCVNDEGLLRRDTNLTEGQCGCWREKGIPSHAATCCRSILKYLIKPFISIPYQ